MDRRSFRDIVEDHILVRRSLARFKLPGSFAIPKVSLQRHLIPVHLPSDQKYRWSRLGSGRRKGIIENREGRLGKRD